MNIDPNTVGSTPISPVVDLLAAECGRLRKLLERLPESDAPPSEELPEIRRLVRLLRSGFSMLGMRKSAARELQAVARVLADPREAVRRIGVWRKLAWNGDTVVAAAVSSMLNHQAGSPGLYPPPAVVAWCVSRVDNAAAHLAGATSKRRPKPADELRRLGRIAAKRSLKLAAGGSGFEAARKALREWTAATAFAAAGATSEMPDTGKLAALLSDERDLTRFAEWLENHGFSRKLAPDLWRDLKLALQRTRKEAAATALEVYSADPQRS